MVSSRTNEQTTMYDFEYYPKLKMKSLPTLYGSELVGGKSWGPVASCKKVCFLADFESKFPSLVGTFAWLVRCWVPLLTFSPKFDANLELLLLLFFAVFISRHPFTRCSRFLYIGAISFAMPPSQGSTCDSHHYTWKCPSEILRRALQYPSPTRLANSSISLPLWFLLGNELLLSGLGSFTTVEQSHLWRACGWPKKQIVWTTFCNHILFSSATWRSWIKKKSSRNVAVFLQRCLNAFEPDADRFNLPLNGKRRTRRGQLFWLSSRVCLIFGRGYRGAWWQNVNLTGYWTSDGSGCWTLRWIILNCLSRVSTRNVWLEGLSLQEEQLHSFFPGPKLSSE